MKNDGIDFTGCTEDPQTGNCCVDKVTMVNSLPDRFEKPEMVCVQKKVEQCHYTYITQFVPRQEKICRENFEKQCSITFRQQAYNETVSKCFTPVEKVCTGDGEEHCETVYETACTTKYSESKKRKFVGDTICEKLPLKLCGSGCNFREGEKECKDDVIASFVDVPEELCDLQPHKTCQHVTKLVPKLKPVPECTLVPKESCHVKFGKQVPVKKATTTRWCLDQTSPTQVKSAKQEARKPKELSKFRYSPYAESSNMKNHYIPFIGTYGVKQKSQKARKTENTQKLYQTSSLNVIDDNDMKKEDRSFKAMERFARRPSIPFAWYKDLDAVDNLGLYNDLKDEEWYAVPNFTPGQMKDRSTNRKQSQKKM